MGILPSQSGDFPGRTSKESSPRVPFEVWVGEESPSVMQPNALNLREFVPLLLGAKKMMDKLGMRAAAPEASAPSSSW